MTNVPTGTELARPFIPARDFDLSKRFYEALGFDKVLDGEVAIFNAGSGGFILQRRERPQCSLGALASPTWLIRPAYFGTSRSGVTMRHKTSENALQRPGCGQRRLVGRIYGD